MNHIMLKSSELMDENFSFHYAVITDLTVSTVVHSHDFYELFFIVSGEIKHVINGQEQSLKDGALVLIRPYDVHYYQKAKLSRCHMVNLAFAQKTAMQVIEYLNPQQLSTLVEGTLPPMAKLSHFDTERFFNRLEHTNTYGAPEMAAKAIELKIILAELMSQFMSQTLTAAHCPMPDWLAEVCREMQKVDHFTQGLDRLYQTAAKSPEHLTRMFQKHMSITPTQYVNQLRLNYAKNLLTHSDQKVIEVCYKSGFENLSHFNHVFKKQIGITPTQFRKINQKNIIPV